MLSTRSVTEELQRYVCLQHDEFKAFNKSTLSSYAQEEVRSTGRHVFHRGLYAAVCGLDWKATTFQHRVNATSRLHDDAVRVELDCFIR